MFIYTTHTYIYTYIHVYVNIYAYVYIYTHSYPHTYIHTQTTYTTYRWQCEKSDKKHPESPEQPKEKVSIGQIIELLKKKEYRTKLIASGMYVCMYVWSMCILSTVSEISLWMLVSSYCRLFIKRTYIHVYTVYCTYIHTYIPGVFIYVKRCLTLN